MSNGKQMTNMGDLIAAQHDLENRCVLKLHCGQSYKAITESLGLTSGQIARIVRESGVSARVYRSGNGPLGSRIRQITTDAPARDIKQLVAVFSTKQLT
jgi:hypothetical protein